MSSNDTSPTATENTTANSAIATEIGSAEIELTDTFYLRFSRHCLPFKLPDLPEVAYYAKLHFQDDGMNVDWQLRGSEKVFIIELLQPQPTEQTMKIIVNEKTFMIKLEPTLRHRKRHSTQIKKDGNWKMLVSYFRFYIIN